MPFANRGRIRWRGTAGSGGAGYAKVERYETMNVRGWPVADWPVQSEDVKLAVTRMPSLTEQIIPVPDQRRKVSFSLEPIILGSAN